MAKYGKKSQAKVKHAMEEMKEGTLKSGKSGKTVTNRKQAIAIGLSEARAEGAKVPSAKKKASPTKRKAAPKKKAASAKRKTAARKTVSRKKTVKAKKR
ncbi:hypothetical protein HYX58_05920 [Candidatus Dependentiae bacterium]|nr:hypothetical protein [Candidatus Dependentiae bacterium]